MSSYVPAYVFMVELLFARNMEFMLKYCKSTEDGHPWKAPGDEV